MLFVKHFYLTDAVEGVCTFPYYLDQSLTYKKGGNRGKRRVTK